MQKIGFKWIEQGKEATLSNSSETIPRKWSKRLKEFEQYNENIKNAMPSSTKLLKWIASQRKHYRKLLKRKVSKHLSWYQVDILNEYRFPWILWKEEENAP
eukprot:6624743-Ditylum_brightwellii.AAC.1